MWNPSIRVVVVLLAALLVASSGCGHVPKTSRTGVIHDVRIEDQPEPAVLWINPGDEVRWINARTQPVQLDLIGLAEKSISCERGFSGRFTGPAESIVLEPNATASMCFDEPSEVRYNIRMTSAIPGGRDIVRGQITVGTR